MLYKMYGFIHKTLKIIINREIRGKDIFFCNIYSIEELSKNINKCQFLLINGEEVDTNKINSNNLYYGDNFVNNGFIDSQKLNIIRKVENNTVEEAWMEFLIMSQVPDGWINSGFQLTGYIKKKKNWCLSSWIWTSAAAARFFADMNDNVKCLQIADKFILKQEKDGGWIVRDEYPSGNLSRIIAPNDSAYIANNALLSAYKVTKNEKYIASAKLCANWIIETSRQDGLVYISKDKDTQKWNTKHNIVDIGFTAGLFAELYNLTKEDKYKQYCEKFLDKYISLFWNSNVHLFHTSIDDNDVAFGGYFARGQAWALEGLIPAYMSFKNEKYKIIINQLVNSLIKKQKRNGSWSYNLANPLMGEDCKGVSVIAKNLGLWYMETSEEKIIKHLKKAYKWCVDHTQLKGEAYGGIFSYTIEGAMVHSLYSETALVYSSVYALELSQMINSIKKQRR